VAREMDWDQQNEWDQQNRGLLRTRTDAKTMRLMTVVISRRSPTTIRSPAGQPDNKGEPGVWEGRAESLGDGCKGTRCPNISNQGRSGTETSKKAQPRLTFKAGRPQHTHNLVPFPSGTALSCPAYRGDPQSHTRRNRHAPSRKARQWRSDIGCG
jgi:hypothetical protein